MISKLWNSYLLDIVDISAIFGNHRVQVGQIALRVDDRLAGDGVGDLNEFILLKKNKISSNFKKKNSAYSLK